MNTRIRLGIIVSFFLALPSLCLGEDALNCDVSGSWRSDSGSVTASGVLCQSGDTHRIYRFNAKDDDAKPNGAYAPFYASAGPVRFLFSDPTQNAFYYADDSRLYVVDADSYKVSASKQWRNAQVIAQDPLDPTHRAIIHDADSGLVVRLISFRKASIDDELVVPVSDDFIDAFWTPDRFVVVEANAMHIYRRSDDSYRNAGLPVPPNDDNTAQAQNDDNANNSNQDNNSESNSNNTPKERIWNGETVAFDRPLTRDDYRCDPNGIMVWDKSSKRLSYYVFSHRRWTRASINATASIRGIGTSNSYALGVTNDMNNVRIVARMGSFLQNRYEAKYWKLSNDPDVPLVVGELNTIALDGGSDNRAQVIDTSEMTWKRVALISYPAPGHLAELSHGLLVTIHPDANDAIIVWHARSGEKRSVISKTQISTSGLADVVRVETVDTLPRYKLVFDSEGNYALFDSALSTLSKAISAASSPWAKVPRNFIATANAIVMPQGDDDKQWAIYTDATSASGAKRFDLNSALNAPLDNMLSAKDKWYGYSDGHDAYTPPDVGAIQNRNNPTVNAIDRPSHRPNWLAWGLELLSILAMLGVMAWRNGWGKPSKLSPESSNGTSALIIDIFDKKNRRMITDRDIHYFIEENFYSKLYFRVLSATILSLGIAVAVALPYFRDDTVATFVSWVLVLATPIFALIWILASWTYWNRRYLLRYGCIVEGKWLNCAKPNQSISYIPEAGKSFELTRNQWHRADYVPIVIFDPSRPNFAIQYTGESEHALLALNLESTVKEPPKNACSFDVFRLAAVLAVLVGGAVATQLLFHAAYPASLSEWRLQELSQAYAIVSDDKNDSAQVPCSEEQNADQPQSNCNATQIDKDERRPIVKTPGTTFTMACLELCRDGDDMCQRQCHTRQLFNILKDAGYDFDGTISITPAEFLDQRRQAIAQARNVIFDTSISCSERAQRISNTPLWNDDLYVYFFGIYRDHDAFVAAQLGDIATQIVADSKVFSQLCDNACVENSSHCIEPPACPDGIEKLKSAVCTFHSAIGNNPFP